jgi:predicted nucleic acid-binding protein
VPDPRYILDTGPLVAAMNARDALHGWAVGVFDSLGEPPVTCEAVLCEACWQLRSSPATVARVLEMPARGDVVLRPVAAESGEALAAKVRKYAPEMDMVDACVARLADIFPRAKIITTDERHFTIYRSETGRSLHLITPR